MEFYEKLLQLRKKKGFSQETLGDEINVTRQTISNWEAGISTPDMDSIIKLAKVFKISTDELLAVEGMTKHQEEKPVKQTTISLFKSHYEFKSKAHIGNIPLVHINIGVGLYTAKGIIAIGNIAIGILSFGILSLGFFAIGVLALGLLSLGSFAFGIAAFGAIALGIFSIGAIAVGIYSLGAVSIGHYSIGAVAIAKEIAYGSSAKGLVSFSTQNGHFTFTKDEISKGIEEKLPDTYQWIKNIFIGLGS